MPHTVTVIGATGLVGSHLVRRLARRDIVEEVHVYARSSRPVALPPGIQWHPFPELDYFGDVYARPGMIERMAAVIAGVLAPGDIFLSCLGTTRRRAGSAERFRFVDFGVNAAFARAARDVGYERYGLVSSVGADPGSRFLYPRVKGELEGYVRDLGFETVRIYRPGVLRGERRERRFGESLTAQLAGAIARVFPGVAESSYASIGAETVAAAMLEGALSIGGAAEVFENSDIQRLVSYE